MSFPSDPVSPAILNRSFVLTATSPSAHGFGNKVARVLWAVVWILLFRPTPKKLFGWRRLLLRLFGAKLARNAVVFPSTRIWAPWNLEMADEACLSWGVDCYNVAPVVIGRRATVSQRAFLCTATHDVSDPGMRLIAKPIVIGDQAWVCAEAFVGPGVTIGEGAVVGARAVAMGDVSAWMVAVGNPLRILRRRELRGNGSSSSGIPLREGD